MTKSPILIVDDDVEDLDLIKEAAEYLNVDRPIFYFRSGTELIQYIKQASMPPFLIICDMNLPSTDGFAVRKEALDDSDTKYKSVPFIFWSTNASENQIQHAYDLPAQGFFFKPMDFPELCDTLKIILDYWKKSKHPKRVI